MLSGVPSPGNCAVGSSGRLTRRTSPRGPGIAALLACVMTQWPADTTSGTAATSSTMAHRPAPHGSIDIYWGALPMVSADATLRSTRWVARACAAASSQAAVQRASLPQQPVSPRWRPPSWTRPSASISGIPMNPATQPFTPVRARGSVRRQQDSREHSTALPRRHLHCCNYISMIYLQNIGENKG